LAIGASYLVLSEYVTVGPRIWQPGLIVVLVVPLLIAQTWGRYRLARTMSFVLLGVVTAALLIRVFFLITTLSGRGASGLSVLVDAVLIWVGNVVTFAVWYWEIDGGGPAERAIDAHARENFVFPQIAQQDGFTTSTAYSPTDTPVLSRRAKVLTVVQSLLSLVVLLVLVGWAVNTL
jgi:hypothetical protein